MAYFSSVRVVNQSGNDFHRGAEQDLQLECSSWLTGPGYGLSLPKSRWLWYLLLPAPGTSKKIDSLFHTCPEEWSRFFKRQKFWDTLNFKHLSFYSNILISHLLGCLKKFVGPPQIFSMISGFDNTSQYHSMQNGSIDHSILSFLKSWSLLRTGVVSVQTKSDFSVSTPLNIKHIALYKLSLSQGRPVPQLGPVSTLLRRENSKLCS